MLAPKGDVLQVFAGGPPDGLGCRVILASGNQDPFELARVWSMAVLTVVRLVPRASRSSGDNPELAHLLESDEPGVERSIHEISRQEAPATEPRIRIIDVDGEAAAAGEVTEGVG